MIDSGYGEWLARGQAHQRAGRFVDAMLCYRRALKVNRHGVQVQFHLGEVLRELGLRDEAVTAWRTALTWQPQHLPSLLALADILRPLSPADAAASYRRALAIAPDDMAARRGLVTALLATDDPSAYRDAIALFAVDSAHFDRWEEVARALARPASHPERGALLEALQANPAAMQVPSLRALVIEHVIETGDAEHRDARALLDDAAILAQATGDLDALRRFASAATMLEGSPQWAKRYAQRCVELFAPAVPVMWPRRAAGVRFRVAYIAAPGRPLEFDDVAVPVEAYLRDVVALHSADRFAPAVFLVGSSALDDATTSALARIPTGALNDPSDPALARALGEGDYDVIVDLAGIASNVGPLLAARPARSILTYRELRGAHVAPLVDGSLPSPIDASSLSKHRTLVEVALESICAKERWFVERVAVAADAMREMWRTAVATHQSGDLGLAARRYADVISVQPEFAPARYLLGSLLRDRGDAAQAEIELTAAVAMAPRYLDARSALANLQRDNHRITDAITTAREGIATSPEAAPLWRALGLAELANHDGEGAREAFERALFLAPADAQTHYNDGVALQMLRRRDDALRAYQRALAFDPGNLAAEFNMGVVFQEQGRLDAAIHAFEQVLARDVKHVPAHKALGEALLAAHRPADWLKAFDRFEAHCPQCLSACCPGTRGLPISRRLCSAGSLYRTPAPGRFQTRR